ncbi:MAG: DUF4340 domain-containing protein [Acidobacteria bacterium]|nr:DUF4340 domain-containing protein [Acidobacteriota bacterium]
MQTRNTVLMALALVAISAFVYFYEIRGREAREEAERVDGLLVLFEGDEVTGLTLTTEDGTVTATKQEADWQITAPASVPADANALDALVEAAVTAQQQRIIVEGAEDLEPFGLDTPFISLVIERGDLESLEIHIGNETPVGGSAYAAVDDSGTVYAGPAALRNSLNKSLFDLRDRSVMTFDSTTINRVELESTDLTAALNREDGGWSAEAPFAGRADASAVDSMLRAVSSADAAAFASDAVADGSLEEFGLNEPYMIATFRGADDSSFALRIGGESTDPEGFYAMREGGDSVFVVATDLLDDFPSDAAALRNRQVVPVDRQRVAEITIERPGQSTLQVARMGTEWSITQPSAAQADAAAVSRLLSGLVGLRADDFGSAGNASTATIRVGLRDAGADAEPIAETMTIAVGSRSTQPGDDEGSEPTEVIAMTPAGGDAAFLVAAAELDAVLVDLFDIRDKTLVEFTPDTLESLDVTGPDGTQTRFTRGDESWTLEGGDLGDNDVADILWDLNYLSMVSVVREWSDAAPDLDEFGLASPRFHVIARDGNGIVADVRIGAEVDGDGATATSTYALIGEQRAVYEISATLADVLGTFLEGLGS